MRSGGALWRAGLTSPAMASWKRPARDGRQVGVQAFVAVGSGHNPGKQLAGVDKVALGFDGVVSNVWRDDHVGQHGVVDAVVTALDVGRKVFADEAVEQGAQHVLLEVPAIDGTPDVIGDFPNLALQSGALLNTRHSETLLLFGVNWGCEVWLWGSVIRRWC